MAFSNNYHNDCEHDILDIPYPSLSGDGRLHTSIHYQAMTWPSSSLFEPF